MKKATKILQFNSDEYKLRIVVSESKIPIIYTVQLELINDSINKKNRNNLVIHFHDYKNGDKIIPIQNDDMDPELSELIYDLINSNTLFYFED